jgi:hypothetical protein
LKDSGREGIRYRLAIVASFRWVDSWRRKAGGDGEEVGAAQR